MHIHNMYIYKYGVAEKSLKVRFFLPDHAFIKFKQQTQNHRKNTGKLK